MSYYRKVIRVRAEDSPNVRRELARQRGDPEAAWPPETPGVLSWAEYQKRRATWDKVRQCIGLDAEFYEGAELLLFPPLWLNRAEQLALSRPPPQPQKWMGVDPAEGGDKSAWAVIDRFGLLRLLSLKTPDTNVVPSQTLALMREYNVPAANVALDRGGGGKQHADRLRDMGHSVRTVAFGETLTLDPKRGLTRVEDRLEHKEERYVYVNRRAEMFGELSRLLDPAYDGSSLGDWPGARDFRGFALPAEFAELRRQLSPIPKLYDREGRLRMLPKNKAREDSDEKTLVELIGCSPDEADAMALAVHAMLHKAKRAVAGAI